MKSGLCKKISYNVFFLFSSSCFLPGIASAAAESDGNSSLNETAMSILPGTYFPAILLIVLLVFGGLLALGYMTNKDLNRGEMRRTIAGTLVVGFTILVFLSLFYEFKNAEIVTAYIQIVGVVIGFYFGTRSASGNKEDKTDGISIENVRFESDDSGNPDKRISLFVRNKGTSSITVDKIYIEGDDYNVSLQVRPQKSEKETIVLNQEWEPEKIYRIKAATTTGNASEDVFRSPPSKIIGE